jgi:acetoin utilization protein AcuB
MTRDPKTIHQEDRLSQAKDLMDAGGFRRLPVVDRDGRLIGILTDRDMREHHAHLHDTRVTGAMVEHLVTIGPDEAIESAVDLVLKHKIGGLPVVAPDGQLVGMITVTDLLRGLVGKRAGKA